MAGRNADQYTAPGAFTYTAPAGRTLVWVTMQGGGSGGTAAESSPTGSGAGGGGSGEYCVRVPVVIPAGGTVSAGVGAGGTGGAGAENPGGAGGDTFFGNIRARGSPEPSNALYPGWTFRAGTPGGGANNGGMGPNVMGNSDGTNWWAGSSGGPHSSGSDPTRIGGPSPGRTGAAANASPDRGGGPSSSTVWVDGLAGSNTGTAGADNTLGAGGGGGGGGGAFNGGTGGDGYLIVEYA